MLDTVIDISRYPLPQQEAEAKAKRRIGLGITGLADALLFCGATYGGAEAVALTRRWLGTIKREANRASAELAGEKGPFPAYDAAILERPNLAALDEDRRTLIAAHGLRNGCLTSIAPTGTNSLLAVNVSSGIEPVFAHSYARKIRQPDGSTREEQVEDYAMRVWRQVKGEATPPSELFVSAQTLTPSDDLTMQAAGQGSPRSASKAIISAARGRRLIGPTRSPARCSALQRTSRPPIRRDAVAAQRAAQRHDLQAQVVRQCARRPTSRSTM